MPLRLIIFWLSGAGEPAVGAGGRGEGKSRGPGWGQAPSSRAAFGGPE